jgi:ligand-binding SRPBCC domain-containing protein
VRRIIYRGGLGEDSETLSTHLKSRVETGAALRASGVPVVEFRASIVIGAGSLSFEMIRALVERLPAMICPRWVDTRAQPIAIDDVLAYLRAALDVPEDREGVFEARLRGLRRLLIPVPVLTPRLSGLWLGLVTPAQARVGRALVEGLRNPTVVRSSAALETFAIRPMTLREAFVRAIDEGGAAPAGPSRFTYASIIGAPAAEVFGWHEQPGALAALTPAGLVRIERQEGGVRAGGRVTVSIGLGPARVRWTLRHHGYVAGRQFCDEQVRGPFALWRHAHLFEPIGPSQTLYQDRIEFVVSRRAALNRLAAAVLRPVLTAAFAHRHRVVRAGVGLRHARWARRWAAAVALAAAAMLQPTAAQPQTPPVRTVPFVDLDRYAGDWFEIARFPNRFQRQCAGDVRASYARRSDGRLDVVNRCRTAEGGVEARGVARIADERTFTRLKERFAPAWLSWLPAVWGGITG